MTVRQAAWVAFVAALAFLAAAPAGAQTESHRVHHHPTHRHVAAPAAVHHHPTHHRHARPEAPAVGRRHHRPHGIVAAGEAHAVAHRHHRHGLDRRADRYVRRGGPHDRRLRHQRPAVSPGRHGRHRLAERAPHTGRRHAQLCQRIGSGRHARITCR